MPSLPPEIKRMLWRVALFVLVAGGFLLVLRFWRHVGPSEVAIVAAILSFVFIFEAVRYVIQRFLKGLRGE